MLRPVPGPLLLLVVLQSTTSVDLAASPAEGASVESQANNEDGSWARIVAACLGVLAGGLLARKQLASWRKK